MFFSFSNGEIKGIHKFRELAQSLAKHGPTKITSDRGNTFYAKQNIKVNARLKIFVDEASMLEEDYLDALITLMQSTYVDVHLAGDIQQSTQFEKNIMTRIFKEYNENKNYYTENQSLPGYANIKVKIEIGREVRRFGPNIMALRNSVISSIHLNESETFYLAPKPYSVKDNITRDEVSVELISTIKKDDKEKSSELEINFLSHYVSFQERC